MPTISKGDLVLVTGASGFIAVHVVKDLLDSGYKVRGTVRSNEKGDYLKDLFKGKDFDYVIADDITKNGVFDEAVKGVQAVAHTASPFHFNVTDPQELIGPAVKGTTGILKSIQKNNPDIKRIVITSSVAAVMSTSSKPPGTQYTEADWNEDSIKEVEQKGNDTPGSESYRASKTLAEKALWEFVEKEKPTWDAVAINPPLVLGEVLHQVDSADKLNTSVAMFYQYASGQKKEEDLSSVAGNWVSVRDVARAHVRALEVQEAAGNRFITGAGPFAGQDYVDALHKHFPNLPNIPVGKPGTHDEIVKGSNVFIGKKATDVLGVQYHTMEETVVEMTKSLQRFGLKI